MKKNIKNIFVILVYIFLIISCKKEIRKDNPDIVTTIFPLYDFVKEVGKEKVNVSMILPPGVEAHSFEPTPKDIIKINESSMFIYIGKDMEPWADDIIKSTKNDKIVVIEIIKRIEDLIISHEDEEEDHEEDKHHSGKDPHIWLDFEIDQKIVSIIAEELSKIDPSNKDFYLKNAEDYNLKLKELDDKYKEVISKCELKTIMYGGHFAFGYLAKRYGLNHISPYSGFTPNSEPTPQKIIELIENIKKHKIEYLFYEELLEPKVAKVISSSTGVKLELLHAAHNLTKDEFSNKITFLSIMYDNLEKLKKGLKYKE